MEYQSPLHKKLYDGNFVFTAETTPPDAANKETLLKKIEPLKDIADAINVTDSPGAKVHMSALTAAIIWVFLKLTDGLVVRLECDTSFLNLVLVLNGPGPI